MELNQEDETTRKETKRPVRPITPEEVKEREEPIPDEVIEAFNELIVRKNSRGTARILQKDVVTLIAEKGLDVKEVFEKGWLDVEQTYRNSGWEVEYDKPGYNETYEANFTFKAPKKQS